ncbi:MAG: preprotein translocase subunit SecG, partial [Lentisphaerae bacterium]
MQILLTFLYVIDLLVAVILITLILLQRSKAGGGLGGLATSSAAIEETLGAGAANVLQKMTAIFALIFLVCTVGIGLIQQYIKTPGKTNPLDVAAPTEAVQLEKNAGKAPMPAAGQQKAKDHG